MPEKAKRYSPEFKEQAAKKVVDNSLPIVKVAREPGTSESTLGFWVKDYRNKIAKQPLPPNGLVLSDHVGAEQVELDSPDDVGDARFAWLAGREVAGFLGLAGAGPVGALAGEGGGGEDLEQERGEREIRAVRGEKP